eukprot:4758060-Lingulodinium_polyedra.AAC.1
MPWAVAGDVLEAARRDWARPDEPAALRRRLQGQPASWLPGGERAPERAPEEGHDRSAARGRARQ